MNKLAVHYSSDLDTWATPQGLFDRLNKEFNFNLDPCALPDSAKCDKFFTPETDGLSQPWVGSVFMNPPYGREIGKWTSKAVEEVASGTASVVVGLVPARTDTQWWNRDVLQAVEVRFVEGRIKFGGAATSAPFPSAIVVWREVRRYPRYLTMKAVES